jgi:hypothetical protein
MEHCLPRHVNGARRLCHSPIRPNLLFDQDDDFQFAPPVRGAVLVDRVRQPTDQFLCFRTGLVCAEYPDRMWGPQRAHVIVIDHRIQEGVNAVAVPIGRTDSFLEGAYKVHGGHHVLDVKLDKRHA